MFGFAYRSLLRWGLGPVPRFIDEPGGTRETIVFRLQQRRMTRASDFVVE